MSKNRYIITFDKPDANERYAAKILSVDSKRIKDGVELMASAEPLKESEVMHLQELGVAVATLTETECKHLQDDPKVLAIEEDYTVYALGKQGKHCCGSYKALIQQAYQEGYRQGMADGLSLDKFSNSQQLENDRPSCPPGSQLMCCSPAIQAPAPSPNIPPQPIPWNIQLVRANEVWKRVTGSGVKLAIIDTGIADDHPDLSVFDGASFVEGVANWNDDNGHGTHCAGIAGARFNSIGVVGVAPQSELYAVKVLNGDGSGQLSWILAGMGWAQRNDINVASMSLGSPVNSPDALCTVAYQRAAENLNDAGCIVVAAAGNSGRDDSRRWVGNPARCPGFMAVAAVDRNRELADFSSRGPADLGALRGIEISAPGVSVNSTYIGGGYRELSGTSMACPHVSGAAALLKELHPSWTPERIRSRLKTTASDLGAPGNDEQFGSGLLDCFRAVFG